jgi:hypothetical protein
MLFLSSFRDYSLGLKEALKDLEQDLYENELRFIMLIANSNFICYYLL